MSEDLPTASQAKAELRRHAFALRKAAHAAGGDAAAAAARAFMAAGLAEGCRIAAGYARIRTEIDPQPLMDLLSAAGLGRALPVIMGEGLPLEFRDWGQGVALVDGPFGASVPETGDAVQPDLVIVPLVAFDRAGFRLGYGGGFYDRSLERLRAAGPVRAVGLAYAGQEVAEVVSEATDQRLDAIVTERGVIRPGEG